MIGRLLEKQDVRLHRHNSPLLEVFVYAFLIAVMAYFTFVVGYRMGYREGYQQATIESEVMIPIQVFPDVDNTGIKFIQIHQPCRMYIQLLEDDDGLAG